VLDNQNSSATNAETLTQVNEQFDREYNQDEYEKKIARIIGKAYKRILHDSRDEYDKLWAAVRFLQREDHCHSRRSWPNIFIVQVYLRYQIRNPSCRGVGKVVGSFRKAQPQQILEPEREQ
jgi:hypothetical protein